MASGLVRNCLTISKIKENRKLYLRGQGAGGGQWI